MASVLAAEDLADLDDFGLLSIFPARCVAALLGDGLLAISISLHS